MATPYPRNELLDAICSTVVYADIFDFPLRPEEIHRDLIAVAASRWETVHAVQELLDLGILARAGPYVVLPGRTGLADLRRDRDARAQILWPTARRFGQLLAAIPFTRMIAVTGSLAVGNPSEDADLDYWIVTAPGRLWLVRGIAVGIVRLARRFGVMLCPNYLLSTRALALDHDDLFTAHELVQARPLTGAVTYRRMLDSNRWAERWLPNGFRQSEQWFVPASPTVWIRRCGETVLGGRLGNRIESWEAARKRQRLSSFGRARFTADICEGHFGNHRDRVLHEFHARCVRLGIRVSGWAIGGSRIHRGEPEVPVPGITKSRHPREADREADGLGPPGEAWR